MPLIINGEFVADPWQSKTTATDHLQPDSSRKLLMFDELVELDPDNLISPLGVVIDSDTSAHSLQPWLPLLEMIAVRFSTPTDGRGFSLARQLRDAGFRHELRAVGALIPDQYAQLLGCGFNAVETSKDIADRLPATLWRRELDRFPDRYQAIYGGRSPIFFRRLHQQSAA